MSFYGTSFIFDGVPCEEFGLMLYDLDSHEQEDGTIGSEVEISEDRIWGNYLPLHYGTSENEALELKIVCVVPEGDKRLDRFDIARIAGWLKKPAYRVLKIVQPDMEKYHYKCIFTKISPIKIGLETIGIEATAICDSPYAYLSAMQMTFSCSGSSTVLLHNYSNVNRYYYPEVVITSSGGDISIVNETDNQRELKFADLPSSSLQITSDGNAGIVKSQDGSDMYKYFNFNFLRLLRGDNKLILTGNFSVDVNCEFPMDIGS